jgi:hypothetical protein
LRCFFTNDKNPEKIINENLNGIYCEDFQREFVVFSKGLVAIINQVVKINPEFLVSLSGHISRSLAKHADRQASYTMKGWIFPTSTKLLRKIITSVFALTPNLNDSTKKALLELRCQLDFSF